ncbi:MAG: hypothetical protein PHT57_14835 [Rhodoferax sp.]|nr:hypothetical protein [Rhodoferax sp.]
MKRDETQAYALDIPMQRSTRKIQPMNTPTITLNLLIALLLCTGAAQAAEPQATAVERPLDLSVPHDAKALQAWRKKLALERNKHKPYGSGYESRGLGEDNSSAAEQTLVPSNPAAGNGHSGGGRSGGGSGGSGGGSGGGAGGGSGGGGR